MRTVTYFGVFAITICTACTEADREGQVDRVGQADQAGEPRKHPVQPNPQDRILITSQDTTTCVSPEPDSAMAVAAAISEISQPEVPLRVSSLLRHHDGMLISMVAVKATVGGGGLVWVDRDGCVMVIKRNE